MRMMHMSHVHLPTHRVKPRAPRELRQCWRLNGAHAVSVLPSAAAHLWGAACALRLKLVSVDIGDTTDLRGGPLLATLVEALGAPLGCTSGRTSR